MYLRRQNADDGIDRLARSAASAATVVALRRLLLVGRHRDRARHRSLRAVIDLGNNTFLRYATQYWWPPLRVTPAVDALGCD